MESLAITVSLTLGPVISRQALTRLYDGGVSGTRRLPMALMVFGAAISAQSYTAPAGDRPALRRSGPSILPGGENHRAAGRRVRDRAGAFGIAVTASGRTWSPPMAARFATPSQCWNAHRGKPAGKCSSGGAAA